MTALQSLISIAGMLVLAFALVNQYRIDALRQRLFELRDALFDDALAGRISFDSPAYKATRILLNGLLRFAHRLSLSRFLVAMRFVPPPSQRVGARFEAMLKASPSSDRDLCWTYVTAANKLVAKHMLSSPLAVPFLVPIISLAMTAFGISLAAELVQRMAKRFRVLDRVAYAEGLA